MTFYGRLTFSLTVAAAGGATALAALSVTRLPQYATWAIGSAVLIATIVVLAHWTLKPIKQLAMRAGISPTASSEQLLPYLERAFPDQELRSAFLSYMGQQLDECVKAALAFGTAAEAGLSAGPNGKKITTDDLWEHIDPLQEQISRVAWLSGADAFMGEPHLKRVAVSHLIEQAMAPYQGVAEDAGISLSVHMEYMDEVTADPGMLALTVDALLSTTIRSLPGGGDIIVRAEQPDATGGRELVISVSGSTNGPSHPRAPLSPEAEPALIMATHLSTHLGGNLHSEPLSEAGCRYTMTIPVTPVARRAAA